MRLKLIRQFIGEIKMVDGPSCPLGEGFRVR